MQRHPVTEIANTIRHERSSALEKAKRFTLLRRPDCHCAILTHHIVYIHSYATYCIKPVN